MTGRLAHSGAKGGAQEELRDLLRLAVVGDHVRWVVKGEQSDNFGRWLGEATSQWRAWADVLAERMVMADVAPDGRVKALARDITRQWVPPGWLSVQEACDVLAPRLRELIEWTKVRSPPATGDDDRSSFAEVASGLATQLTVLLRFGTQV